MVVNPGKLAGNQPINSGNSLSGILSPGNVSVPGLGVVSPTVQAAPVAQRQAPAVQQPAVSGGGGDGGAAAAVSGATTPAVPSLSDYINNNFLYQQQQAQNNDALSAYDAATQAQTQETQAEQALKQQQLSTQMNQLGQTNADNLAAHGLLDSGINFQNQDKINSQGNTQQAAIDALLTNLTATRAQGRQTQQQANNTALQNVMQQLTQQYAGTQTAAV